MHVYPVHFSDFNWYLFTYTYLADDRNWLTGGEL